MSEVANSALVQRNSARHENKDQTEAKKVV